MFFDITKSSTSLLNVEQVYEGITIAQMRENAKFVLIMEEFNVKIGQDDNSDNLNVSRFGLGQRNSRQDMLVNYWRSKNLCCVNSFLKKVLKRRLTWSSPNAS